jgi:hypothetical protein
MSLLWREAAHFQLQVEAAVKKPRSYTTEMHPNDLVAANPNLKFDRDRTVAHERWGPVVHQLAQSIKQHGYQPEMHGHIHQTIDSEGRTSVPTVTPEAAQGLGLHQNLWGSRAGHVLPYALQEAAHGPVAVHVQDHRPNPKAKVRYYHGTTAEGLDEIHPNHASSGNFGPATHEPGYAYATPSKEDAWDYATRIADESGGKPRMYEVKPNGPVESDPHFTPSGQNRGNNMDDVRSRSHFTVVKEHKPPKAIHDEYYRGSDDGEEWGPSI